MVFSGGKLGLSGAQARYSNGVIITPAGVGGIRRTGHVVSELLA